MAIGRFAPTPSGPLHFGSLLAAVASYLDIKSRGGLWLLRMDDLDPHRTKRKIGLDIIESLERHGLVSDAPCIWQSERHELYEGAIAKLRKREQVFECLCSRKQIAKAPIYPGTCRKAGVLPGPERSTRFLAPNIVICLEDGVQGPFVQDLAKDCGDFVVYRRDGVAAYHLATVVDDADMGITHILRGADLLASTPRQVGLCQALGLKPPSFAHIPVVVDARNRKASKRLASTPIDSRAELQVKCNLAWCMELLGLRTPTIRGHSTESLLRWATQRFSLDLIPKQGVRSDFICL